MPRGRRLSLPLLALVAGAAPTLTACGLFDGGSPLEDAFEYLPADTYQVRFADRLAMAERLEVDDADVDVDEYIESLMDERESALAGTELTKYVELMADAPLNDLDVVWEAEASWGEPGAGTRAFVWKVDDHVDFDELAADLVDKGYDETEANGLAFYSVDISAADEVGMIGGTYPISMLNVMLNEDEQIVAAGTHAEDALADLADVMSEDADSLADDGGMDHLVDLAEEEPEIAWLSRGGPGVCRGLGPLIPPRVQHRYRDLGHPESRAFFVVGGDSTTLLALTYGSDDAARDDLEARQELLNHGTDPRTSEPFADLGEFDIERDGEVLLIHADYAKGSGQALAAERDGAGPGTCLPADFSEDA